MASGDEHGERLVRLETEFEAMERRLDAVEITAKEANGSINGTLRDLRTIRYIFMVIGGLSFLLLGADVNVFALLRAALGAG